MSSWCKGPGRCFSRRCLERGHHALAWADPAEKLPPGELLPVFYLDQDDKQESPCRMETKAALRDMKRAGDGRFFNHGKAFRLAVRSPMRRAPLLRFGPSRSKDSPASISFAEMQANVGIAGEVRDWQENAPAPRHLVRRAQEKIAAIGADVTYDPTAPLAFGRWAINFQPGPAEQLPPAAGA